MFARSTYIGPRSAQSLPGSQRLVAEPARPSSHSLSPENVHVLLHPAGVADGGWAVTSAW
jgi:hypothetical protein